MKGSGVQAVKKKVRNLLTQEFAVCPKYFARPVRLIDKDPKESTKSGLVSSSLMTTELGDLVWDISRWSGAFILRSSSVRSGCCSGVR
jgi:hypothetical protein